MVFSAPRSDPGRSPTRCKAPLDKSFSKSCIRRRQWHHTPVLLPGKSHGRRSLVGCSPWGRKDSDMTERLHFHFSLSCIGEGNGNPLQCSCLEKPRDRGAWWAAVYGVAQSRTRLKRLSSSSSSSIRGTHLFGDPPFLLTAGSQDLAYGNHPGKPPHLGCTVFCTSTRLNKYYLIGLIYAPTNIRVYICWNVFMWRSLPKQQMGNCVIYVSM